MLQLPRASPLLRLACSPRVTPSRGRKTRHDPPAKSKVGRIKYPPVVEAEELLNIRRRYNDYTAIIAALRLDFRRELQQSRYEQQAGLLAEQRHQQEVEEHNALMAWNQEENRKALLRRVERVKLEDQAFQLQRAAANQLEEETKLLTIQDREKEVELLQELSKTFITAENLTERIEAALDHPKCYNFCLDRGGRVLRPLEAASQP